MLDLTEARLAAASAELSLQGQGTGTSWNLTGTWSASVLLVVF